MVWCNICNEELILFYENLFSESVLFFSVVYSFLFFLDLDWVSINLGIIVCIECLGIYRNLGIYFFRVRSFDLDEWS